MAGVGDRRGQPEQSHLEVDCLHDPHVRSKVKILRDLIRSCRGPHGKAKVIQNSNGGHVTWTKTSSRLFSAMSVSTPILKLVTSSVQAHIDRFQNGGFLTAEFCLSLIDGSLDLDMHKRLLIELYEEFMVIIDNYLNSKDCLCKFEIDVFKMNHVMRVLRSLCEPKLSHFSDVVQEKMCILFLDVFLSTIPLQSQDFFSNKVFICCFDNSDILESTCLKGLLLECPELSSSVEKQLQIKTSENQRIQVALVAESMSGDSNSFLDATYELDELIDSNSVVVNKLLAFCQRLVDAEVGLLLCQRVIHPKVKAILRGADVKFVDRLGSQPVPYIKDLTGARPISLYSKELNGFGWLENVSHQIVSGKSYLLLERQDQPIVTLVLKSSIEEHLQELKVLSQMSVNSLNLLLRDPWVLSGGGCWASHVAAYLSQQVNANMTRLMEDMDCSEVHVRQAVETFTNCLMSVASNTTSDMSHITDSTHHHIWKSPGHLTDLIDGTGLEPTCVCGIVMTDKVDKFEFMGERKSPKSANKCCPEGFPGGCPEGFPEVVDVLCVVRNSLKMAVATSNTVLGISQFIHDST